MTLLENDATNSETLPTPNTDGVRAFDQSGREVIVPREEWRTNVLPNLLQEVWEQPENLYMVLLNSFNDGFFPEVVDAAAHLAETDPIAARGACMHAIALTQTGQLEPARLLLEGFLATHPVDGSVLVNLAKVYAAEGDQAKADSTLWRALELDPNLDNGLAWYAAQAEQQGGEAAAEAALNRVAALPGSWRPQLWLARGELSRENLGAARQLYNQALDRAPRPVPADLLMQMSGDLGSRNHLAELIDFTAPFYLPEIHGLPVGNNLIKANVDLGRLGTAEAIKNSLERLNQSANRPDWTQALAFWTAEIAQRRGIPVPPTPSLGAPAEPQMQIGILRIDGPIWLPLTSPARGIFGAKPADGPSVTFLGGTAEAPPEAADPNRTPEQAAAAELLARMTRTLPLFLAEQTDLLTGAHGRTMLPWAVGAAAGFVVSGAAWTDAMAVQVITSQTGAGAPADYVVSVHIDAEVEPWTAMLAFVRTADGTRIGEIETEFSPAKPEAGLRQLAAEVVELLGAATGRSDAEATYAVPAGDHFPDYLHRLEQLLAIRCAGMDGVPARFLTGERGMLTGQLELCAAEPANVAARLVLLESLAALDRTRPAVAEEFRPQVQEFNDQYPLSALANAFR
jgi:tetratricopeptide (TPR) repeat protein